MKKLSNYIPYILAGVLFFTGRWTSPKPDKELMQKYESERKYHLSQIDSLKGDLVDKDKAIATIRKQRYKDSLKTSVELRARDRVILKQQKENEKINLSRASATKLDSLRARLLTLYPVK